MGFKEIWIGMSDRSKALFIIICLFFVFIFLSQLIPKDSKKENNLVDKSKEEVVVKITPTPTIKVEKEDVDYFNGVMEMMALLTDGNTHIEKAGDLGTNAEFDKAFEEVQIANSYFQKADTKLKSLSPTDRFKDLHSLLKNMMLNYTKSLGFYMEGTRNLEPTTIEKGSNYYSIGTEDLSEAKKEIEKLSKDLNIK